MADRRARRLVAIPSDPIAAYEGAGYSSRLQNRYNPEKMFTEVYVVSPLEKGIRKAYGITILGAPERKFSRVLRDIKPDVVRAFGGYWPADLACRYRLPGVPVVVSVHDTNPTKIHRSVRYADLVMCVSRAVEKRVIDLGADPRRIRLMPNWIDTKVFRRVIDPEKLQSIGDGFPPGKHILHVGRKSHEKNLDTLIHALRLLPPEYSCIFIGAGDQTPYLSLAQQVEVSERCFWVNSVKNTELPIWYSWSDCLCVPSRWEGFGIVFIEAAACGAGIVTSDIAPLNEYLAHDISACLVKEYENPQALAEAIHRVCDDAEYRNSISAGAVEAAQPFDWRLLHKREAVIYREAMNLGNPSLSRRLDRFVWRGQEYLATAVGGLSPHRIAHRIRGRVGLFGGS